MSPCLGNCQKCVVTLKTPYVGSPHHKNSMGFQIPLATIDRDGTPVEFMGQFLWREEKTQMSWAFAERMHILQRNFPVVRINGRDGNRVRVTRMPMLIAVPSTPEAYFEIQVDLYDDAERDYFFLGRDEIYQKFCVLFTPCSAVSLLPRQDGARMDQRRNCRIGGDGSSSVDWLTLVGGNHPDFIRIEDASAEGLCIRTRAPFRPNDVLKITLSLTAQNSRVPYGTNIVLSGTVISSMAVGAQFRVGFTLEDSVGRRTYQDIVEAVYLQRLFDTKESDHGTAAHN